MYYLSLYCLTYSVTILNSVSSSLFIYSKLSTCMGGLQAALLPFHWQHTLITVVPSNLISISDLCEAPTPYLIGLLKTKNNENSLLPQFTNKQQVRKMPHLSSLDLVQMDLIYKIQIIFYLKTTYVFTSIWYLVFCS